MVYVSPVSPKRFPAVTQDPLLPCSSQPLDDFLQTIMKNGGPGPYVNGGEIVAAIVRSALEQPEEAFDNPETRAIQDLLNKNRPDEFKKLMKSKLSYLPPEKLATVNRLVDSYVINTNIIWATIGVQAERLGITATPADVPCKEDPALPG